MNCAIDNINTNLKLFKITQSSEDTGQRFLLENLRVQMGIWALYVEHYGEALQKGISESIK